MLCRKWTRLFDSRDQQISRFDQFTGPQRGATGIFLLILGVGLGVASLMDLRKR
jgi:hypothetical protein